MSLECLLTQTIHCNIQIAITEGIFGLKIGRILTFIFLIKYFSFKKTPVLYTYTHTHKYMHIQSIPEIFE